jgi:Fe-S cluster assembly protein SufD
MTMTDLWRAEDVYRAAFERVAALRSGPLAALREEAFERFCSLGFPTTRDEEWRSTNVSALAATCFRLAGDDARPPAREAVEAATLSPDWPRLVFVDGRYAPALSCTRGLPRGVRAGSLGEDLDAGQGGALEHLARNADHRQRPFAALNTALFEDGAFLLLERGALTTRPVHVAFVWTDASEPVMAHPRLLVVAGEGAEAVVVESYIGGEGVRLTNAVTEIVAGDGAVVQHYRCQLEGSSGYHVALTRLTQGRDANVTSHATNFGAALARNDVVAVLAGPGGHCKLDGLYLAGGNQHVDNNLRVEHASPHCDSREFYKGVLDGRSRAVFAGRIIVHKDAQKTDAKQTNMNLLLSDDAQADSRPQLEIRADDVKCTHGATIGRLDEGAMFYLRARGLRPEAARDMLVYAFAAESLERVRVEPLRRRLRELLLERLPQGRLLREAV